ncbi:MAG: hypothetical protein WC956_07765 [bacterium]
MFLLGCSDTTMREQSKVPTPQRDLPTSFAPGSHVPELWEDIKKQWLSEYIGHPLSELEKRVDRGFTNFDLGFLSGIINKFGTIEAQEVLEYAYARENCYHLLAKHGFPVPFAMNDYDPTTKKDDEIRDKISAEVKNIQTKYEASKEAAPKGSDKYKEQLALLIRDGLKHYRKDAEGDCKTEMPDWKAIATKCGACTEFSAILYFAYRQAGLDPRFMNMTHTDGSITAMSLFFNNDETASHSLIGVPLSNGTYYYSDLAILHGGRQDFYSRSLEISPRQFVEGHLADLARKNTPVAALSAAKKLIDVAPEGVSNWVYYIEAKRVAHELPPQEFERIIAGMRSQFGNSPLATYAITLESEVYRDGTNSLGSIVDALSRLEDDKNYVKFGTALRTTLTSGLYYRSPAFPRANLLDIIRQAAERDPYMYSALSLMNRITAEALDGRKIVEIYSNLHKLYPEHKMIRQLLGSSSLTCWEKEKSNPQIVGGKPTKDFFTEGMAHLTELAERLDPEALDPHFMLCKVYFETGDFASSARELRKLMTFFNQGEHGFFRPSDDYVNILKIACALGEGNDAKTVYESFLRMYPGRAASESIEMLSKKNNIEAIYALPENRSDLSAQELKNRAENVGSILAAIPKAAGNQSAIGLLSLRHAFALLVASKGDETLAGIVFKDRPPNEAVIIDESFAAYLNNDVAPQIFMIGRSNVGLAEKCVDFFARRLLDDSKRLLVPLYIVVALQEYRAGHETKGNGYLREAFVIDKIEAEWAFHNWARLFFQPAITSEDFKNLVNRERDRTYELTRILNNKKTLAPQQRALLAKMFRRLAVGFDAANDTKTKENSLRTAAEL